MPSTNIAKVNPDGFLNRINMYVPAMAYAAEVRNTGLYRVSLAQPPLAIDDTIVNGNTVSIAGTVNLDYEMVACPFGRCIQVASNGTNTDLFIVEGYDYLGQKITENFTLNGASNVVGRKAFFRVTKYINLSQSGRTIDIGTTDKLGLPYKTLKIAVESRNGVAASSLGTFVSPSLTDPQTATLTDPRGTYNPSGGLNGVVEFVITAYADDTVNASNNGGLYGIAHFAA